MKTKRIDPNHRWAQNHALILTLNVQPVASLTILTLVFWSLSASTRTTP